MSVEFKVVGDNVEITIDEQTRKELEEWSKQDEFTWEDEEEWLQEQADANGYDLVTANETGDLTSAPMIGYHNEKGEVTERWAYMDYQVKSIFEDLIEFGKVVFIS